MEPKHKRAKTDNSKPRKKLKRRSVNSPTSTLIDAPTATISDKPKSPNDITQILSSLNKHILFTCLQKQQRKVVIHHMKFYSIQAKQIVFQQDSPGSTFFVVISGRLNVIVNRIVVNILTSGDSFGQLALIHDTPRSATIQSIEPVTMWGLDRATFRHAVEFVNQQHLEQNKAFIQSVPLFSKLRKSEKLALLKGVCTLKYDTGFRIVKEGDSGDMFYIIKEGLVSCSIQGKEIRHMVPGDFFGQQAMLFNCNRTASITAVDVVKCLSLSRQKLGKIFSKSLLKIIYQNSLRMAIQKSEKLSVFSKDQIDRLMAVVKIQSFKQGQVVVPYGSVKNSKIWIILFGKLEDHVGCTYDSFRIIGDTQIIRNSQAIYDYNILAKQHSDIGIITKKQFQQAIGGQYEKIIFRLEALDVIRNVQLFKGLQKDRYYALVGVLKQVQVALGEIVTVQGSFQTRFIIVKSGCLDVYMDQQKLISLGPNDIMGEKGIIANEASPVTSIASQDSILYVLQQQDYIRLVDEPTRIKLMRKLQLQDDSISLDDLIIVKLLGKGSFGNVYLTYHKFKHLFYALKTISRKKIQAFGIQDQLLLERQILFQLQHHLILKLFKTFKDKHRLYFLQQYVPGAELFDVLRMIGPLSENDARFYTACLIEIIQHLNQRNIIYRDLKPENIIVDEQGYLKLLDFGTAKFLENGRTYTQIGTPHYMSPEAISGKGYGFAADYWSIGVMIFEFLCGTLPFGVQYDDPMMIYKSILKNKIAYPVIFDQTCGAKALIQQLLNKDPSLRSEGSIASAKEHPWFRYFDWLNFQIREVSSPYKAPAFNVEKELEMAVHFSADIREKILQDESSEPTPKRVRRGKKVVDKGWDKNF